MAGKENQSINLLCVLSPGPPGYVDLIMLYFTTKTMLLSQSVMEASGYIQKTQLCYYEDIRHWYIILTEL